MQYELEVNNIKLKMPKRGQIILMFDENGKFITTGGYDSDFKQVQFWAEIPMDIFHKQIAHEIFERIKQIGRESFESALKTSHRLCNPNPQGAEIVSDGELLDALFQFSSHLDIASPLGPVVHAIFERYMLLIGMEKTPGGFERDWFHEDENWEEEIAK